MVSILSQKKYTKPSTSDASEPGGIGFPPGSLVRESKSPNNFYWSPQVPSIAAFRYRHFALFSLYISHLLVCILVLFSVGLDIPGFNLPLKLLLYQGFCIEPRDSAPIFLQGLLLRSHPVQCHSPDFICNLHIGVWVISLLAKFNQIREFLLYHLCGHVQFPEPNNSGFNQSLVLRGAKGDQSVVWY